MGTEMGKGMEKLEWNWGKKMRLHRVFKPPLSFQSRLSGQGSDRGEGSRCGTRIRRRGRRFGGEPWQGRLHRSPDCV